MTTTPSIIAAIALVAASTTTTAPANTVILHFDDIDAAGGTILAPADHYANFDAVFSAPIPVADFASTAPDFWSAYLDAGASPVNAGFLNDDVGFTIDLTFPDRNTGDALATNLVTVLFGDTETGTTAGTIEAYDAHGRLLDTATAITPRGLAVELTVEAPEITRIRLIQDADGGAFDNITFPAPARCIGDTTGDCIVDINDLLELLAAWGPCPPECPADLDTDGHASVTDLLIILGAWSTH